jgi:tRNA A37 methylthiotransferase MiaB
MKKITNYFGTGILYEENDLKGKLYVKCCACVSIYSDFESWANANEDRFVENIKDADTIIVLGCQVTDLAVLSDIKAAEKLIKKYPQKEVFIGGCIAKRFDIDLPAKRLDIVKSDYIHIKKTHIFWGVPFWVKDYNEGDKEYDDGHLFRKSYPLRIGVGCKNKCTYCTIRITRGICYELTPKEQIEEFLNHENILLNADSPSPKVLLEWIEIAKKYNKQISIRNVEPQVAMEISQELIELSELNLLKSFHMPVQSVDPEVLKDMGRNPGTTLKAIEMVKKLKNTFLATNIIIDYKEYPNPDITQAFVYGSWENEKNVLPGLEIFDYVSWNPYWDGKWNRNTAEKRFKKYIGE